MDTPFGQPRQIFAAAAHDDEPQTVPQRSRPRPHLSLAAPPAITLALPPHSAVPEAWQAGLDLLFGWLGIVSSDAARPAPGRFGQLAEWAAPFGQAERAPVFAPWQVTSPAALQQAGSPAIPPADWLASYVFDYGAASLPRRSPLDLLLMSPHPAACEQAQAGDALLPRLRLIQTMIAAAKAEGRRKLAIIVDAGSRNAMISRLVQASRTLTREGIEIDILSIEDALGALIRQIDRWDAIIVMPQWRGVVCAVLAERSGIGGPMPVLWYRRGLLQVTSEAIDPGAARQALDAPLMVLGLAAALRQQGQWHAAHKLYEAAARLWDRGVATPGRPSAVPYAHHLSDAEFLQQITSAATVAAPNHRPMQCWRLLAGCGPDEAARIAPDLRLVGP